MSAHVALREELRLLHRRAGTPVVRAIAARCSYSHTTVAEVLAGQRTSSLRALCAVVTVLGGDVDMFGRPWMAALGDGQVVAQWEHDRQSLIEDPVNEIVDTLLRHGLTEPISVMFATRTDLARALADIVDPKYGALNFDSPLATYGYRACFESYAGELINRGHASCDAR